MKKIFSFLIVLLILGSVGLYRFYAAGLRYARDPSENFRVIVDVPEGATADEIAALLKEKGLIKSQAVFNFYLKKKGLEGKLQSGRRVLSGKMILREIVEALLDGRTEEVAVTLLEGWTAEQMAEHLESLGLTTADDFLTCLKTCDFSDFDFLPGKSLEGYLFPDTYFVDPANHSDARFIRRLLQTFRNKFQDDWGSISQGGRTLDQIVTMASIVEREERNEQERPRVAGILWKRLDSNRGLDADATILYALNRTKGGLSYQDLQVDSPYNTRKYRGLPPTPISNPGLSSLRAALHPEDSPYWYYLHDSEGGVHYGKTLEEHNQNKARYLR